MLLKWTIIEEEQAVLLEYTDCVFKVRKSDFDRAFGTMVNGPSFLVKKEFEIEQ